MPAGIYNDTPGIRNNAIAIENDDKSADTIYNPPLLLLLRSSFCLP